MTNSTQCAYFTKNDIGRGETRQIGCDQPVLGRFVRISKPVGDDATGALTLCEVEIYGRHCTSFQQ